jgi:hypothetical protein
MTEAGWLKTQSVNAVLWWLRGHDSPRKWRMFAAVSHRAILLEQNGPSDWHTQHFNSWERAADSGNLEEWVNADWSSPRKVDSV